MHKPLCYFLDQSLIETQEGRVLGDRVPSLAKQSGVARSLGTDKMATGIVVPTLIHTPYPMSESLVELGISPSIFPSPFYP